MTDLVLRATDDAYALARTWANLNDAELKRRATAAAHDRDRTELHRLTTAFGTLTNRGHTGALSPHTIRNYRAGINQLLIAWTGENLLRPTRDAGALYVAGLVNDGCAPATVEARLAGARALYRALRWADATPAQPFEGVRAPKDPTPPWERRQPYSPEELTRLLRATDSARPGQRSGTHTVERIVVLLGAHAGLRASEMLALQWADIDTGNRTLVVTRGKGGKRRTVNMSPALTDALQRARHLPRPLGTTRSPDTLAKLMLRLCSDAGVTHRALHSLRHSAGTRLYAATKNLVDVAHHLGHANLDTTRIYAKWNETAVRDAISKWDAP